MQSSLGKIKPHVGWLALPFALVFFAYFVLPLILTTIVSFWDYTDYAIIPDLIFTKLGIIDFSKLHVVENEIFKGFNLGTMLSVIFSFNFFRLSELQELLFVYYFMWHSLFLRSLYFK